jgi:hypothetical protein
VIDLPEEEWTPGNAGFASAGLSACGEHRRLGYSGGLTCGGALPAALSSAMICRKHWMP